ncbi:hypothetical protein ABT324_15590 [Saccharopolyspora sp. NPDC000359]|uniref:hypothetical protein n=1 Tax=Saccharopolyspora sp. NPDC000359 TaxID=3154251 RepID=UPI003322B570
MNLPDRIRAHVEELRSAPDIVVTTCDIGSGPPRELSADDVDLISDRWGADAVDGTRDYLLNTDRIHLSWHSVAHYVHGEFALTDIRSCMTGWIVEVEDERLAPEKQELLWELKGLEEAPGSGRLTALRATNDELWFYDITKARLERLALDFQSYVDNLLLLKGAPNWQYLFADVDLCDDEFTTRVAQLDRTLEALPILFPDHDYSHLQQRYEERCSGSPVFRRHKSPWAPQP